MPKPSKAQWDEIKENLSRPYGVAYFKCDDYLICADIRQDKMKLVIQVAVNGWIKGKWWWFGKEQDIGQMPEIAKRFYCLKKKGPAAKKKAVNIKIFGKKYCREKGMNDAMCSATPWFSTPGSFIAHLKKHNPSIDVLDYETYTQALKALPVDQDEKNSAPTTAPTGEAHA